MARKNEGGIKIETNLVGRSFAHFFACQQKFSMQAGRMLAPEQVVMRALAIAAKSDEKSEPVSEMEA